MKSDVKNLAKDIKLFIKKRVDIVRLSEEIGEYCVKNIVGSTRMRKPAGEPFKDENGNDTSDLSDQYYKVTKPYLEKYGNNTGANYRTGKKSNLTMSGQLLSSIKYFYDKTKLAIRVTPTGIHMPYRGKNGEIGVMIDNLELASYVNKRRRFMLLGNKNYKVIANMIKKSLRRTLAIK
jgi:hypothetical protein